MRKPVGTASPSRSVPAGASPAETDVAVDVAGDVGGDVGAVEVMGLDPAGALGFTVAALRAEHLEWTSPLGWRYAVDQHGTRPLTHHTIDNHDDHDDL